MQPPKPKTLIVKSSRDVKEAKQLLEDIFVFYREKYKGKEKEYSIVEKELQRVLSVAFNSRGEITIEWKNRKIFVVIDRFVSNKVKFNEKVLTTNTKKDIRVAVGQHQPTTAAEKEAESKAHREAILDIQKWATINDAKARTVIRDKLIKEYHLEDTKSLQVHNIGESNKSFVEIYFYNQIVNSFIAVPSFDELNSRKCNIKIDAVYNNNSKKDIYVCIDEHQEENNISFDIRQLFQARDVLTKEYKDQRTIRMLRQFGIHLQLFANVFDNSIDKKSKVIINNRIDQLDLENMIKVLLSKDYHYADYTGGTLKNQFRIDQDYFNKAMNIESIKTIYDGKGFPPRVEVQIITNKLMILVKFVKDQANLQKPSSFTIDWALRDAIQEEQTFFS